MSTTKQRVLKILITHPQQWCSGDALARELAVSRESISKAVARLRRNGHQIESRTKRGYRYLQGTQLDADAIQMLAPAFPGTVTAVPTTASTQWLAKQALRATGTVQAAAFLADEQTAGYGRRGRAFYSPKNTGLYLSLVLPNPDVDLRQSGLLTTGVAVNVVRVLQRFYPGVDFGLKWVNDIEVAHHKVGGIITEADVEVEADAVTAFVVGIGLNLTTTNFPDELASQAAAIAPTHVVDRNQLAAALLTQLVAAYQRFPDETDLAAYRRQSVILGRPVQLQTGQRTVSGIARTIDDQGALVLEHPDGTCHHYLSGEVVRVHPAN
ncbi:biotin--[acetyl-CoA-carboxylase] ligase [Lactiplantibacillus modestisalitolerans]|uniref:Bifunctional ligase/repressor BirA n=1 Tax=Lactiplantibacillus modestisalitolerans TaxID=1457219 RepID=A0ABV5WTZ8_9LACO|nr:biotin--[acetyl-CoA-carboxylase] ligase [Lactiplantibacillus modestisalitolerans]